MLAIRHLADRVAQYVFADLGTFMLDRAVKSISRAAAGTRQTTSSINPSDFCEGPASNVAH